MANKTVTIKCGRCDIPIQGPADAKDEDRFSCPQCGTSDTLKNIKAEVAQSAEDQMASHFDNAFAKIARASKALTYKSGSRVKQTRRFIVDLDI